MPGTAPAAGSDSRLRGLRYNPLRGLGAASLASRRWDRREIHDMSMWCYECPGCVPAVVDIHLDKGDYIDTTLSLCEKCAKKGKYRAAVARARAARSKAAPSGPGGIVFAVQASITGRAACRQRRAS